MTINVFFCNGVDLECGLMSGQAGSMIQTSMGRKRADALVACTPASKSFVGQDANGGLDFTAVHGSVKSNLISVELTAGPTGAGHESRALAAAAAGMSVAVTFGTDGAGDAVTPTAADVAAAVAADPDCAALVAAAATGTGAGLVNQAPATLLEGGMNDGDWIKFTTNPPVCSPITRIEVA